MQKAIHLRRRLERQPGKPHVHNDVPRRTASHPASGTPRQAPTGGSKGPRHKRGKEADSVSTPGPAWEALALLTLNRAEDSTWRWQAYGPRAEIIGDQSGCPDAASALESAIAWLSEPLP